MLVFKPSDLTAPATYRMGHDLRRFSAAPGTGPWKETRTACHWAICWELVRETKELFPPWENAESSKPTVFIGAHQFSWHFQETVSQMQERKRKVIFILGECRELKKTNREKRLQTHWIHWPSHVRASSSIALPDGEPGLDLLSCVLWANICLLENSWRGEEGRYLSLYNFCKTCLKRPGFVPCQNSSSDTLQIPVDEDSTPLARSRACIFLHLICIVPAHQAAVASVPYVRVTSLQGQNAPDKAWALSSSQSTTSFLFCAKTFLFISQLLPR